jgi:iron complex transport system substrate-binding protein
MVRIVSLIPSATEIVCALGAEGQLVGRSHECDFPPGVARLPALTSPKMDPCASTAAIDREVRALVEEGLSVYQIDVDRLEELAPDLVVTQDQCQVCAVALHEVTSAVRSLTRRNVEIVSLSPLTVDDVKGDIRRVGAALGAAARAQALVAEIDQRLDAVAEAARTTAPRRPRVVHIEWIAPLMVGGHWIPELVDHAGGEHALGVRGGRTSPIAWEQVRAYDPEIIVVSPCGFEIPQSEKDRALLEALPGWSDTAAARSGRVYVADGNAFFNRPGPRLVETAEIVQAVISGRRDFHRFPPEALQRWS